MSTQLQLLDMPAPESESATQNGRAAHRDKGQAGMEAQKGHNGHAHGVGFKPGSKAAYVMEFSLDVHPRDVVKAAKLAGVKISEDHVFQVRSAYRAKLRKAGFDIPKGKGRATAAHMAQALAVAAPAAEVTKQRRKREPIDVEAGLKKVERELLRCALDIGFGRSAALLARYRDRLNGLIDED